MEVFTVKKQELVTPHLIRITFHIPERLVEKLKQVKEGSNNKLFIPPQGIETIYFPNQENTSIPKESIAQIRTYTNRKIDLFNRELKIDFVLHKGFGPASNWASKAKPGDAIGIGLKQGLGSLVPKSNKYFLVGDHTALPVICNILEQLPEGVEAEIVMEVHGAADEIPLLSGAKTQIIWLHNPHPEDGSQLASITKKMLKNQKETYTYIAAEYKTVNELRDYLKKDLLCESVNYHAVSYWKIDQ